MGCAASCGGVIEVRHSKPSPWSKLPPPARKYIDPNPAPKEVAAEDTNPFYDAKASFELKTLAALFNQFDASGDGFLQISELARAFRAIGLTKRNGDKYVLDETHFRGFDTSGARVAAVIPNPKKACGSKLPFHTGVLRGCILPAGRVA